MVQSGPSNWLWIFIFFFKKKEVADHLDFPLHLCLKAKTCLMGITTFPWILESFEGVEMEFSGEMRFYREWAEWGFWRRNQREEKSTRKESGELWSIRNQSPLQETLATLPEQVLHSSDWNVEKVLRYFWERHYFYRFENIAEISVFLPIFWEIFQYFLPVQAAHRIQNLSNFFFLKKHEMLFGNLIMICKQRLCFSWLKNLGFRVREI